MKNACNILFGCFLLSVITLAACNDEEAGGEGDPCGGLAGLPCGADYYCDYPDEPACGDGDTQGTCQSRPDVCAAEENVVDPVCGCDGEVYPSACEAYRAGVDVDASCSVQTSGDEARRLAQPAPPTVLPV